MSEENQTEIPVVNRSEAPKEGEVHKAEDIAAAFFRLNEAKLVHQLDKLSIKQLRRVLYNACAYPFVKEDYKPETTEEQDCAYVVHEMMLNKTIMQLSFEMEQAEKATKNQESNETNNNLKKGE